MSKTLNLTEALTTIFGTAHPKAQATALSMSESWEAATIKYISAAIEIAEHVLQGKTQHGEPLTNNGRLPVREK